MKKKILISAYACEPNKGSEPEVGWRWVIDKAKEYDEVVVVTRANNRENIEKELPKLGINNVKFEYFDLPKWVSWWKKGQKGIQLYAYLWEIGVFCYLLKRYRKKEFDVAQRVTFVSYRFPSFIWYFSKKFIFGPVAGGERFPLSLLSIFSFKGKIKEIIRMLMQRIALIDPLVLLTLYKADKIIAVTEDTKTILPKWAQKKTIIKPAIKINLDDFNIDWNVRENYLRNKKDNVLRLLYVGRLLEWKGIMLVLEALKDLPKDVKYEFTIVGDGPDRKIFEDYVKKYNLNVKFVGKVPRKELSKYYLTHDLFVFPSLHDSGGMAVLEAKAHGLPVVVINLGGPKMFVGENDFIIVGKKKDELITKLKNYIIKKLYY